MKQETYQRSSTMIPTVIYTLTIIFLVQLLIPLTNSQFNACPKACVCDEETLESICKDSMGSSGLPHTLNPITKKIIINHAGLTQLTQADLYPNLETLDLAHNRITSIDFGAFAKKSASLTNLNASHNLISHIDDNADITNINQKKKVKMVITDVDLSHNRITNIKNMTFSRLHKLQRLDLSYNLISLLEEQAFIGLYELEYLNLRSNLLKHIPTDALSSTINLNPPVKFYNIFPDKTSQLKYLDLAQNDMRSIEDESFPSMSNLMELNLEASSIIELHDKAFEGLNNLVSLNLNHNQLPGIPSASFRPLRSLKYLKLSNNSISNVTEYSFAHLSTLEELQMNDNIFKELKQGSFSGLYYLRKLEITNTSSLTTIEKGTFDDVRRLRYLNLNNNSITSLPEDHLSDGPLTIMDLRNNKLHCGCELKWLTKWFIKFNQTTSLNIQDMEKITIFGGASNSHSTKYIESAVATPPLLNRTYIESCSNLTCYEPIALAGKFITELPQNNLECLEPTSELNLRMGFACLFIMIFLLTLISFINYCRYQRHLFVKLKQSFVQHHQLSTMNPSL